MLESEGVNSSHLLNKLKEEPPFLSSHPMSNSMSFTHSANFISTHIVKGCHLMYNIPQRKRKSIDLTSGIILKLCRIQATRWTNMLGSLRSSRFGSIV